MICMLTTSLIVLSAVLDAQCDAQHAPPQPQPQSFPVVALDYGSFRGLPGDGLVSYLGIPFAKPPIGSLRFALPQPPESFSGVRNATSYGAACLQQAVSIPNDDGSGDSPFPIPDVVSEDCLFINVVKPANVPANKKLPVIFFIYPGGFEFGNAADFDPSTLIKRSATIGQPSIYVSANYRLNAFGFLGGKEVRDAKIGNAGLEDQRLALKWVQKHISQFGGDPSRVAIWGVSAGAISAGLQMVVNDGNAGGLFHRVLMQSGSPMHLPTVLQQQKYFDQIVELTNCATSSDRLNCLRSVPADQLVEAINKTPNVLTYQSLNLAYVPMVDGRLITRDPLESVRAGIFARVPIISGDSEDEGTQFSLSTLNITTNAEFLQYMKSNYFPNISSAQLRALERAYPEDVTQGSPFGTGSENALSPQFKRLAAVQGDYAFQAPRRFLLDAASKVQPAYAFRNMRNSMPPLGVSHGSDLNEFFGISEGSDFFAADALIRFAYSGNPNPSLGALSEAKWKLWSSSKITPPELTFVDPAPALDITSGTYRKEGMDLLIRLSLNEAQHA